MDVTTEGHYHRAQTVVLREILPHIYVIRKSCYHSQMLSKTDVITKNFNHRTFLNY